MEFAALLVIPFVLVFSMIIAEELVEPLPFTVRTLKSSWDICVFALGTQGGVLADKAIRQTQGFIVGGELGLASIFLFAMLIGLLRKKGATTTTALGIAVVLAALCLAIPAIQVLHSR
jgi:hypothetical protein